MLRPSRCSKPPSCQLCPDYTIKCYLYSVIVNSDIVNTVELKGASGTSCGMEKSQLAVKVGQEIRRLRRLKNRSQEDFADDCGVHRTSMGAIERGERVITLDTAKRVVNTLGITLGEFFSGIDE